MDLDRARYQAEESFRHIKPQENAEVAFIAKLKFKEMPPNFPTTPGALWAWSPHYPQLDLGIFSASQHR
ncbi:hypothetical protein PABG_12164 [Paracoccidioides brasiliensis Pb03]|nr:hypothetical protein PABG_12164 [Paracoccidioides brasiliensis Pb03]